MNRAQALRFQKIREKMSSSNYSIPPYLPARFYNQYNGKSVKIADGRSSLDSSLSGYGFGYESYFNI